MSIDLSTRENRPFVHLHSDEGTNMAGSDWGFGVYAYRRKTGKLSIVAYWNGVFGSSRAYYPAISGQEAVDFVSHFVGEYGSYEVTLGDWERIADKLSVLDPKLAEDVRAVARKDFSARRP